MVSLNGSPTLLLAESLRNSHNRIFFSFSGVTFLRLNLFTPDSFEKKNHDMSGNMKLGYADPMMHEDLEEKKIPEEPPVNDPFGNEEGGEVQYRVMTWW